jgi:transposase
VRAPPDSVRSVLSGASVTDVAAAVGVSRVSVHAWLRRCLTEGSSGLAGYYHRPVVSSGQRRGRIVVRSVTGFRLDRSLGKSHPYK